jgi:hypothetical protein
MFHMDGEKTPCRQRASGCLGPSGATAIIPGVWDNNCSEVELGSGKVGKIETSHMNIEVTMFIRT